MATAAVTSQVGQGNGGSNAGTNLEESQSLYHSAISDDVSDAASNVLNQRGESSSEKTGGMGSHVDEGSDSCCGKVGNCFKGFFPWNKTKTE